MDGPFLARLDAALRTSWDEWTSSGGWSPQNPAMGQCAVSALVVQTKMGGDLLRSVVGGRSHYWNLIDGDEIDLTRDQFAVFEMADTPSVRTREYVLSYPETRSRYERLLHRVEELLQAD